MSHSHSLKVLRSLLSFDSADGMQQCRLSHQHASIVKSRLGNALKVHASSKEHFETSLELLPTAGEVWDWSTQPNFCLALTITNEGAHSTQMFFNIFNHQGDMHSRSVTLDANSCKTYLVELKGEYLQGNTNYLSGCRSNPAPWGHDSEYATWMWGNINLALDSISRIELSIQGSLNDHDYTLHSAELVESPPVNHDFLTSAIDRFGQNSSADYANKVTSDNELTEAAKLEKQSLAVDGPTQRSTFSGFTGGKRYKATGYFRTQKIDGVWSLIDPLGYPYFATGLDVIRLANAYTLTGIDYDHQFVEQRSPDDLTPEDSIEKLPISDKARASALVANQSRRNCFEWLPSYDDPLAEHYGYMRELFEGPVDSGETFSFYAANLARKYGHENYLNKWREVTLERMANWGFTSLGNWAAPELYNNDKVPYFANGWIIGDFKTVSSGDDFWSPLPDPFDPKFAERALETVAQIKKEVNDSPWCVGVFIDNEKSWGRMGTLQGQHGIAIHTLSRDARECPTKQAFVTHLQQKYVSIHLLNLAWETRLTSWKALSDGVSELKHTPEQLADYGDLLELYASQYFKVVSESVKHYLPNHLYMGARFADWGMTPDVVKAAAKHCDVISYNYYKEGLHPEKWDFLSDIDKPSIIGEFHIGSKDPGFYHPGLVSASNQQERADMYQAYMQTIIDNPYFVGAHWFQYLDSPISGRSYDGENYNVGFVSVTDTPYEPMVKAAKMTHERMYTQRYAQSTPVVEGVNRLPA